jgi:hypothetical protein
MTGGYTKRIGFFVWYFFLRPRDSIRWFKFLQNKDRAIDACIPWMTWPAIDFLNENIKPGLKVLEWGAGGSTFFFLKKGCNVTSIENSEEWAELVEKKACFMSLERDLNLRFFPAKRQDRKSLHPYIQSVNDGGPWDVIVVDGIPEVRVECIRAAMRNIAHTGIIILDDAYWVEFAEVPVILKNWKRVKFRGLGPERRGVSQTDMYFKTYL